MATYNVAKDGSGNYTSIAQVNSAMGSFQPGDQILFKRDDTFDDATLQITRSGTNGNEIIFGAYGTGDLPIIGNNDSISLEYAARVMSNAQYIIVQDLEFRASKNTSYSGGFNILGSYITIQNCVIKGSTRSVQTSIAGMSISAGSSYVTLRNNNVSHFGNGIVGLACPNTLIEENIVHDIQREDDNAGGWGIRLISNTFEDTEEPNWWYDYNYTGIIRGNEVYGFSRYAIDCATASRVIIEDNHIHSNISNPNDDQEYGSGIKAGEKNKDRLNEGTVGTIVRRNIIHNLHNGGTGEGTPNIGITTVNSCDGDIYYNLIYDIDGRGISRTGLSEDSQQVSQSWTIYNNTIISGKECIYTEYQTNSKSLIKNNIFQTLDASLPALYCKTYRSQVTVEDNIFVNRSGYSDTYMNDMAIYYPGNNAVIANNLQNTDPLFTNVSIDDYSVLAGSPAINEGATLPVDKQGNAITLDIVKSGIIDQHDIGAYEYTTASQGISTTLTVIQEGSSNPPPSNRVTRGLQVVYDFLEGTGNIINDKSGVGSPLNLTIKSSIKP